MKKFSFGKTEISIGIMPVVMLMVLNLMVYIPETNQTIVFDLGILGFTINICYFHGK